MASIVISNIAPVGADFFSDSENYLQELQNAELASAQGGGSPAVGLALAVTFVMGYLGCQCH